MNERCGLSRLQSGALCSTPKLRIQNSWLLSARCSQAVHVLSPQGGDGCCFVRQV